MVRQLNEISAKFLDAKFLDTHEKSKFLDTHAKNRSAWHHSAGTTTSRRLIDAWSEVLAAVGSSTGTAAERRATHRVAPTIRPSRGRPRGVCPKGS